METVVKEEQELPNKDIAETRNSGIDIMTHGDDIELDQELHKSLDKVEKQSDISKLSKDSDTESETLMEDLEESNTKGSNRAI